MSSPDANSTLTQLRNDILDGSIEPACKLSIAQLGERYAASAAPVREALSSRLATGAPLVQIRLVEAHSP